MSGRHGAAGNRFDVRRLMINPAFGVFWLARTASLLGDYAFRIAFITTVVKSSHSPDVLAIATAVLLIPAVVFYIFGGALGDRARSRRAVLVGSDILRALATSAAAVSVMLVASPVPVVAFALLIGVGSGFFEPVAAGFLVQIVPKDRLVSANSALSVSRQIGLIAGPVLGGALVAVASSAAAFWFDAASFAASALCLLSIPRAAIALKADIALRADSTDSADSADTPATQDAGRESPRRLWREIGAGVRYVAGVRWLLVILLVGAIANAVFAGGLDVLVPLVFLQHHAPNTVRLGLFYSLEGAGALVGALILARLVLRRADGPLFGMLAMMAASLALVGVVGDRAVALTFALSYGIGMHFFNSLYPALVQTTVPGQLLSRVSSLEFLAFDGLMPVGIGLMGPLSVGLGSRTALLVTGGAIVTLSLAVCAMPAIRELRLPQMGSARTAEPGQVHAAAPAFPETESM